MRSEGIMVGRRRKGWREGETEECDHEKGVGDRGQERESVALGSGGNVSREGKS